MSTVASAATARSTLAGFYLSGVLMSFLGAILPAWDYHLHSSYAEVGYYFLAMNGGILLSMAGTRALQVQNVRIALTFAAALAAASFFYLAAVGPPRPFWWRAAGLAGIGLASGLLHTALFRAISPVYRRDPAAALNLSGLLFGLGCLTTSLLVAGTFHMYTTGSILIFLGLFPAFLAVKYVQWKQAADPAPVRVPFRQALTDFQSPAAVLFALLLFCQFGNEWSIAGWLPLFLAQRLGASPSYCVLMLALYWLALTLGRIVAQAILPKVHHGKMLMGSVVAALLGCLILSFTDALSGAAAGILITGLGFAPIYPLVVEKIGRRFSYYHPGVFNGLFSLGVTGGLLAPALLGWITSMFGVGVVMLLPVIGSCAVFVLLVVIFVENKLTRLSAAKTASMIR